MVSEEDFNGIRNAQRAITKLETDGSISVNSVEHQALLWAVIRLGDEILFNKEPLTGKDLERALAISGLALEIIAKFKGSQQ